MSSVVKRATRSFSFRAMRKKNENKLTRPSDSDDDDSPSSSLESSPSKSKAGSPPSLNVSSTLVPSPRSATSPPSSGGSTIAPAPLSSPGSLSNITPAVAVNDASLRGGLQEGSRSRINSVALSPRRAALDAELEDDKSEVPSKERRDNEAEEGGKTPRGKGRGRSNSTPAPRPSIVPSLTGLSSLSPNSPGPAGAPSPGSPTSPRSPKVLGSSKSSSSASRKSGGSGGGGKLKQSKSARMPKSARGEGWSFTAARGSISSSDSLASSSSKLGSSSSKREPPVLEVTVSQGWVRKHHITAEEARDHNTLVALMPSSMRRNIPMGDLLSSTQWLIDDDAQTDENGASGENEVIKQTDGAEEAPKEATKSTNVTPQSSGEIELAKRRQAIPPLSSDQPIQRTLSKDGDKSSGFMRRGSAIAAAIASPRAWLGKKEDKDGVAASPPGSETNSPKERRKGWWEKKEKEEGSKGDNEGKTEHKWRSRSKRLLRKKADGVEHGEKTADKIQAIKGETQPASAEHGPAEEPSEGEDEEDIRGEEYQPITKAGGAKDANTEAAGLKETTNEAATTEGEPSNNGNPPRAVNKKGPGASEERRPSVAKTMKMAMEEELLTRVKERAPTVTAEGQNGDDEEEEDELFFSESNEAVVIQLPQAAE